MEYGAGSVRDGYWTGFSSVSFDIDPIMQFTGLHDKSNSLTDIYEGDIIDKNGRKVGNIYENHKRESDLVIQGFGTKDWEATNKEALVRGCTYTE